MKLAQRLDHVLLETPTRPKKGTGAKLAKGLSATIGGAIADEIAEWVDAMGEDALETREPTWTLELELDVPGDVHDLLWRYARVALSGLCSLGSDEAGDQPFVSIRDGEVYRFVNETGELAELLGTSMADFLARTWGDVEGHPIEKPTGARARWERSRWLLELLIDRPSRDFAAHLAQAPTLEIWRSERDRVASDPHVAIYWLLAHLFLGNDDACKDAITRAKKAKGKLVVQLAKELEQFLGGKTREPWDGFRTLAKARSLATKNALASQTGRPPAEQDATVKMHDDALRALTDRDKAKVVEAYFRERADDAATNFALPDWLVEPAAAAFRSGLRYDESHPDACAGVTRGLAQWAEHPAARGALIAALDTLAPADDRLAHVVPALIASTAAEARDAVRRAAWRWLDVAHAIDRVLAERERSHTLDDLFAKDDLLQPTVNAVLAACDDEAERLANAMAEKKLSFRVLRTCAGAMFRVWGQRGRTERADVMFNLLGLLDIVDTAKQLRLDQTACVLLAEVSLAAARLAPERARDKFADTLTRSGRTVERQAAVAACLLPGLLTLDPEHAEARRWLERVLAGRTGSNWLYGALLAVREAKLASLAPAIVPHAYLSHLNVLMEPLAFLERTARSTLDAIGAPEPPFDASDEYAEQVADLGDALLDVRRYNKGSILRTMDEAKDKQRYVPAIGRYLEAMVRASVYEADSVHGWIHDAARLLETCGKPGKDELARLRKLPEVGDWAKHQLGGAR